MQIQEGSIVRFRCHTGHAFSAMTLLTDISDAVNEGLWSTIRALEERQLLLQQLSELSSTHGHARARDRYASEATKLQEHIRSLRSVAMSGDL
jgi:two-component system chemotaxis response regulator CheB